MKLQRVALPAALAAGGLAAIAWFTLKPAPEQAFQSAGTPLDCLVCGDVGLADVLLNVALFVPFGAGLAGLGRSLRFTALTAFLVSLTVELLQLTVVAGRDATLSDLLTNTTGGVLGWSLIAAGMVLLYPATRTAGRLALAAAATWSAAFGLSAWALHPDPAAGVFWGQWAHDFGGRGTWAGKVIEARLDGTPVPDEELSATTGLLRRRLASGDFALAVRARSGRAWEDNAQIFGIANERGEIFLEWRQKGRDYEFTMRSRAARLRLHSVDLLLPGAAPAAAGEPVALAAEWRDGAVTISAAAAGRTLTRRLVLAPAGSWRFVWPWGRNRGEHAGLQDAVWLALGLLVIGYWSARARRSAAAAAVALVAAALLVVPQPFGLQRTSAAAWVAAALGLAAGAVLAYIPSARRASGP